MAATFRPVNTPLTPADSIKEETIAPPTTPRPSTAPSQPPNPMDDATTPTRASFGVSALASQKPLPTSPFPESVQVPDTADSNVLKRENSQHSRKSKDSDDMDMDDSDGEGVAGDDGGASDDESVNADGSKSKKKKSQRFYCTDYPPCNLSFTRSEHLARHIRKHTGERPFQCHCSRRFSRLDNLRQHAQTVHVNEEIPMDSLAATGTRFQRQIRTDRVRQAGGRARAATAGSVGPTGRGHSKSLSTSSITSVSSIGSAYSANEARRRPPPLVMADPRSRVSLESYRSSGADGQYYRPPSPSDFSTPTSATFSTGQNSPRWGSGVASPISSHSRSHSMYAAGSRTPGRRLSVPSGGNPFQSPHGVGVRAPLFSPGAAMNSSNSGAYSPSQSSLLASPTASTSTWSRRDSTSNAADEAWRRRTWHPDTRDYNGASRLSQVISSSQFPSATVSPPVASPRNQPLQQPQQMLRLPGIESFDPLPPRRPPTPPRRNPSPMMIDSEPAPLSLCPQGMNMGPDDRQNHPAHWDTGLHRGLTRLDINTPPRDSAGAWAQEVNQAVLAQADQVRANPVQPTVRFDSEVKTVQVPSSSLQPSNGPPMLGSRHQHTMSAPAVHTPPRDARRHGWYHGPVTIHPARETIHEGRPHVDRIVHPNISGFQGFPARDQQPILHHHHQQQVGPGMDRMDRIAERPHSGTNSDPMRRLEALVAVATSEGSNLTAY
ncbi:Biofilm and cell wall regulator 1 [Diplogelasinospora grovesii]|uniref:Biofilm and cell wall regulator 1 n=1 Tax=Diplogelasinospora grovesii TaxID=303347 RepID=A0AAN6MZK2_9PEZI|nr:Biofilm and cell wall regulator 1 [Diplogelasinospora grovesii]